jgi:hypothetical protein
MINWFKRDFRSVYNAMKLLTNDKMPDWLIVIWYIVLFPLGMLLMPFAWLFNWYVNKQINK